MKNKTLYALLATVLLLGSRSFGQFKFASIDVPNSMSTWASAVGPGGQIVGGYMGMDGLEHGYLYKGGTFSTIDVPGSLAGLSNDVKLESEVNGINPAGDMVGDYYAPPGAPGAPGCVVAYSPPCRRGFLYRHGEFSNVLVPNHLGSIPNGITPDGSIYGCLHDTTLGTQMFGFVRTQSGDYKTFQYATLESGGGEVSSQQGFPVSMNNSATPDGSIIVGLYIPSGATRAHGFIVQNGVLSDYMVPNSLATQIWSINPTGEFVGLFRNGPGLAGVSGFLQRADGSDPITIKYKDPVSGVVALQTQALGINPGGAIVGMYLDASGGGHGFLAVQVTE